MVYAATFREVIQLPHELSEKLDILKSVRKDLDEVADGNKIPPELIERGQTQVREAAALVTRVKGRASACSQEHSRAQTRRTSRVRKAESR